MRFKIVNTFNGWEGKSYQEFTQALAASRRGRRVVVVPATYTWQWDAWASKFLWCDETCPCARACDCQLRWTDRDDSILAEVAQAA